MHANT
jgi:hypothetical protein